MRLNSIEQSLWLLFERLLRPQLKESLYSASLLGYEILMELDSFEMQVRFFGFHDKSSIMLEKILSIITNLGQSMDETKFKTLKKSYIEILNNLAKEYHLQASVYYVHLLTSDSFSTDIILNSAQWLQYKDMEKFLARAFRRLFIRSFIHGNCTPEMAQNISNIFEKHFHSSSGLLLQETLRPRTIEIPEGSHFVYQLFDVNQNVSGYSFHYYVLEIEPPTSHNARVSGSLLYDIIEDSIHKMQMVSDDEIEKEAPEVSCNLFDLCSVYSFALTTPTEEDPRFMDSKVEKLLRQVSNSIKDLTENEFEQFKETLKREGEYKTPSCLEELSAQYWKEIRLQLYDFHRHEKEIEQLLSLKKVNFLAFFKERINKLSRKRTKLALHIFTNGIKQTKPRALPAKAIKIENEDTFKANSNLLPFNFGQAPDSFQNLK